MAAAPHSAMTTDIALVTGATAGIGRAIAWALGRAGYSVGVTSRTPADVDALVEDLTAEGIEAAGRAADVADSRQVGALLEHVATALGPVDTLVNNAGVLIPKPFVDLTLEEWDLTFATNVRGVAVLTKAVLPGMIAAGKGDIVNVASLAGKNGVPGAAAYSAAKHAVLGFSRSLMLEVRAHGIRVIAICPGSVDTPMMRNQNIFRPNLDQILKADDVAATVVEALSLPRRAMVSELDIRPASP
jgi:3-oxoacyl-[acyl-carrier protein] reductase